MSDPSPQDSSTQVPAAVRELADSIVTHLQEVLGQQLVGLYAFGSLAGGDFLPTGSDIDLLCATTTLDTATLEQLKTMHDTLAGRWPDWSGRIETAYIPLDELRAWRPTYQQPMISPGEPFHVVTAGPAWVLNRQQIYEQGIVLFGPDPTTLIDPVSGAAIDDAIEALVVQWADWLSGTPDLGEPGGRAYTILTLCRLAYSQHHQTAWVGKRQAAIWVQTQYPAWATLVGVAISVRDAGGGPGPDELVPADAVLAFSREVLAAGVTPDS